ncbi:hypothetical protein BDD12DRAFT_946444, partial [Trichophaea hybrida]
VLAASDLSFQSSLRTSHLPIFSNSTFRPAYLSSSYDSRPPLHPIMSADKIHSNSSINSTPTRSSNSTPPSSTSTSITSTSSTSTSTVTSAVTSAHYHPDTVLNELRSHTAPNIPSASVMTLGHDNPNKVLSELSTSHTALNTFSTPAVITGSYQLDVVLDELPASCATADTSSTPIVVPEIHRLDTVPGKLSTSRSSSSGTPPPSLFTTSLSPSIVEQVVPDLSPRNISYSVDCATVVKKLEMPSFTRTGDMGRVFLEEVLLIEEEEEESGWDFKCIGLDHDLACSEEGTGRG